MKSENIGSINGENNDDFSMEKEEEDEVPEKH